MSFIVANNEGGERTLVHLEGAARHQDVGAEGTTGPLHEVEKISGQRVVPSSSRTFPEAHCFYNVPFGNRCSGIGSVRQALLQWSATSTPSSSTNSKATGRDVPVYWISTAPHMQLPLTTDIVNDGWIVWKTIGQLIDKGTMWNFD
jgi:hypothetical protein